MHFRLIEETETYRTTYDDGPGSLRYPDVVKSEGRVLDKWFGDESDKGEIILEIREYLDHYIHSCFIDKGTHFYIECRENDSSEWRAVS